MACQWTKEKGMKKRLSKLLKRKKKTEIVPEPQLEGEVPRITNETVAEHREEVLSTARKYIYPLQHSKHKVVVFTTGILIFAIVFFFSYCTVALYKLKTNSAFLFGVTKVIPFPIAKAGPNFVAYENYLFELRHYVHYYETQQKTDFKSDSGKQQLSEFKRRALDKVINDSFTKELAKKNKVSVSDREVDDLVRILRAQNRLGGSDKVFEDVLKEYWGWSVDDFKRSLRSQLLAEKLVAKLDTEATSKAATALAQVRAEADFGEVAKNYSDDQATKNNGGDFGFLVDKTNRDLPSQTTDALFKLQPGQTSDIVNNGFGLEILKVKEVQGDKLKAAHIIVNFKDINVYLNDLKDREKARSFVKL